MLKFKFCGKNLRNFITIKSTNTNTNKQIFNLFALNKSYFSSTSKVSEFEELKKLRFEQIQLSKLDNPDKYLKQESSNSYFNNNMENDLYNNNNNNNNIEEDSDFLILSNEEKILSKVLLRNILYSDKSPLPNNENNDNDSNSNDSAITIH